MAHAVAPSQLEGISTSTYDHRPDDDLLGITGFSSEWIEDYAIKTVHRKEIRNKAGVKTMTAPLRWALDAQLSFETLNQEMQPQC